MDLMPQLSHVPILYKNNKIETGWPFEGELNGNDGHNGMADILRILLFSLLC